MARFWMRVVPVAYGCLKELERAAAAIPDPQLRAHALGTLRAERFNALGAALVATTLDWHDAALVRLLTTLQVAWDYIDTLTEQPAADPIAHGRQVHRALVDAISGDATLGDYFRLHPSRDDGGYLATLVQRCRAASTMLPTVDTVRPVALRELRAAEVQPLINGPAYRRAEALQQWAAQREDEHGDAGWIELAAASSSSLGILAMLAAGADPATTTATVERVCAAYVPWIDALTALLDSHVDRCEDADTGAINWIGHYPSDAVATDRLQELTARASAGVRELPRGGRHLAVVAGMIAMYVSQPAAWSPAATPATRAVLSATDTAMAPLLLAMLRTWRRARAARALNETSVDRSAINF